MTTFTRETVGGDVPVLSKASFWTRLSGLIAALAIALAAGDAAAQCKGLCGGAFPEGCDPSIAGSCLCFCDRACFAFGDCCADVCDACPDLTGCAAAGACCVGPECGVMSSEDCAAIGGTYLGDGTNCPADGCPIRRPLKVELAQLLWPGQDGEVFSSNHGRLSLTIDEPDPDTILWINARFNGLWLLQNEPVMEMEGGDQTLTYSFNVPFVGIDVAPGMAIQVQLSLTIDPLADGPPPSAEMFTLPVAGQVYATGAMVADESDLGLLAADAKEAEPVEPLEAELVPHDEGPVFEEPWERVRQREVPGVSEHLNHCSPGAFARMLAWLNERYCLGLPDDNQTAAQLYDKLRNDQHMDTSEDDGTVVGPFTDDGFDLDEGGVLPGIEQFLEGKNLGGVENLPDLLTIATHVFRNQDPDEPAVTPCDLYEHLKQGKGVVAFWGYYNAVLQLNRRLLRLRDWTIADIANLDDLIDHMLDGGQINEEQVAGAVNDIVQDTIDAGNMLVEMANEIVDLVGALDPPNQAASDAAVALRDALVQAVQNLENATDALEAGDFDVNDLIDIRNALADFFNALGAANDNSLIPLDNALTPAQQNEISLNSRHRGFRTGGHAITVVGAVKCGDAVTIFYRDDSNQGDGNADTGVKVARFVPGGASGWTLGGHRWEGYITICPTMQAMIEAAQDKLEDLADGVDEAADQLAEGEEPSEEQLQAILDRARDVVDITAALNEAAAALAETCPGVSLLTDRILGKAAVLVGLAEFLQERASETTTSQMQTIANEMAEQLDEIQKELSACKTPEDCPADLTGDGVVNVFDLLALLAAWGPCDDPEDCPADLSGDGTVNVFDLLALLAQWGPCP